ncbi:hypothetical protein CANARDRAFT_10324 [[Candida] arabinofermentans NRRL YB-2248]|uniref:Alternative oxidase n=1 Tax=[Candida] arabinofermentans NRRL YB-2248 TaxID=983967 RepID=A0A1E4ST32_9ASCO|nr:hypothetical protein CANARDRAFT_10324 [[Candida] arabinofermentans NRRL YB-2248]
MLSTVIRPKFRLSTPLVSRYFSISSSILNNERILQGYRDSLSTLPPPKRNKLVKLRKELPPPEEYISEPTFQHPIYDVNEMHQIKTDHREATTMSDSIALLGIKILRTTFDFFTNYREPKNLQDNIEIAKSSNRMTPEKWLTRFIILESVAGIPGSVAGFLRHLHSMRMLRRDKAFIETLYDEAYNERMHLLTFMQLAEPGLIARSLLIAGQGVFCNIFFMFYLVSPKICHRFVGYLEEEAVHTYTRCLEDLKLGLLPGLNDLKVPDIAKNYWHMKDDCTMEDLINYVRADEAKHREVNHTFANLNLSGDKCDRNPFALEIKDVEKEQPSKTLKNHKAKGWERSDLIL